MDANGIHAFTRSSVGYAMAEKMAAPAQKLSRWPIFSLLEPDFLASIKLACVFGGAGNEAIVVTVEDEVFSLGSNCSSCLGEHRYT